MAPPSPFVLRFFLWYVRRHLHRHFHAVRMLGQAPAVPQDRPLIAFINHPSWWDPLTGLFLSSVLYPERQLYGPMDARQLKRFPILGKCGLFGIEPGTALGARQLLRAADAIFAQPGRSLWLTPQGRFADVRERPLGLAGGLEFLARRHPNAALLPIALEYTFWNDRLPEILVHPGALCSAEAAEDSLAAAMDTLRSAALTRDAARFTTLLSGKSGTGGVYDIRAGNSPDSST